MARAIAQETQQLETDLNEERSRYQNLLTEHLRLEEKYDDLKEEMASSVRISLVLIGFFFHPLFSIVFSFAVRQQ